MSTGSRAPRTLALIAVLGLTLAACALPGQQGNAQTTLPTTGTETDLGTASYPAPGTATVVPPTAAPPTAAPATAVPATPIPATAVPPATTLLGPEWTVLFSGDLNANGAPDAVGWLRSGVSPGPSFGRPPLNTYLGPSNNIVIVEANREGRPVVRLSVVPERISADNQALVTFAADRRPAGFMVQVNPRGPVLMDILQVNTNGEPFAQGIGIRWNAQSQAYRISAAGGK